VFLSLMMLARRSVECGLVGADHHQMRTWLLPEARLLRLMSGSRHAGSWAFSRFFAAACGGPRGCLQRSNTSMTRETAAEASTSLINSAWLNTQCERHKLGSSGGGKGTECCRRSCWVCTGTEGLLLKVHAFRHILPNACGYP
jgi:hypothetical protein